MDLNREKSFLTLPLGCFPASSERGKGRKGRKSDSWLVLALSAPPSAPKLGASGAKEAAPSKG